MIMKRLCLALAVFLTAAGATAQQNNFTPAQPVSGAPVNRSTVNASVVITAGNTFQTVLASNLNTSIPRQQLTINNNNATDSCWIYLGAGAATVGKSILLLAGATYRRDWPFVPSDAIQATCATTADTLYVDYQ
jgi:hypothetical protein